MDAAAWVGRKFETAAPRGCLRGVGAFGRHLHPDGDGWNRSIWPMLCIGEMPGNTKKVSILAKNNDMTQWQDAQHRWHLPLERDAWARG
jgi:hypothetical protein